MELINVINAIQWKSPHGSRVKEHPSNESVLSSRDEEERLEEETDQVSGVSVCYVPFINHFSYVS